MLKKRFSLLGILLFSGIAVLSCYLIRGNFPESVSESSEPPGETRLDFLTDFSKAVRLARQERKPLLVFFMEPDCIFSQEMLKKTFCDRGIIELSHHFICVQVDISDEANDSLCHEFQVTGSPTIQFISSSGIVLQRLTQLQSAERLERQMQVVLHSIAWRESRDVRLF